MKLATPRIYGIIGYPIEHSLSPCMHNAAFNKLRLASVYLPFPVKPDKLKEAIASFKKNRISGFNVTIPHKSACMRYLDKITPLAKMIGAVNTVKAQGRKLVGYNTDCIGFVKSLKEELGISPNGISILVLGAGGAARAACFGLAKEGAAHIAIYDIVQPKVKELARNIRRYFPKCLVEECKAGELAATIKTASLLVNCTPLGMKKNDPLPIDIKLLHGNLKVYDIVYTPLETVLVKRAKKMGVKSIGGLGMLLYQGVAAFELWTGKRAPVKLMRRELLNKIA